MKPGNLLKYKKGKHGDKLMEINRQLPGSNTNNSRQYTFSPADESQTRDVLEVHPDQYGLAEHIDTDKNFHLSNTEIKMFLKSKEIIRDPEKYQLDEEIILDDYKYTLLNKPLPQTTAYRSYQEMIDTMKSLEEKYPNLCRMEKIGESFEGRDLWALKVTRNEENNTETARKPGIVITGLTHAREWMTGEVTLFGAQNLLENYETDPSMKKRVDNAETWFVPCVNPDGYEYSRNVNAWWRKNRNTFEENNNKLDSSGTMEYLISDPGSKTQNIGDSLNSGAVGVDVNRNFWDGTEKNHYLYRLPGDSPTSTVDDKGASDNKTKDTYRGPYGNSEKENQALTKLYLENENIKVISDFHSYGNLILFPWGYGKVDAENKSDYMKVGQDMAKIIKEADNQKVDFKVMQAINLYPTTGSSADFQHANGIFSVIFEIGRSFQPSEKEIEPMCKRMLGPQMYLIDYVIDNADKLRPGN
jgi:murein tripeptide amidase MpaA